LHAAAYEGHEAVVRLLLANGAKVNVLDCKNETPLDFAENAYEKALAELLRKHGAKAGQDIKAESADTQKH
jgi:ankyrin repeat protein